MGPSRSLPPYHNPPYPSISAPTVSPKKPSGLPLTRLRVPQPLELVSTRNATFAVTFKVGGKAGVRVRDVLGGKVSVDGEDERVFEQTGVRQFRLVIDVSPVCRGSIRLTLSSSNLPFVTVARVRASRNLRLCTGRQRVYLPERTREARLQEHPEVHAEKGCTYRSLLYVIVSC